MTAVKLTLDRLTKQYRAGLAPAVDRLDMEVEEGHLVALLGPSGCGKTTTLRMVAGLMDPTAGRIVVDGRDITATPVHERGMGMVFQSYALFPHMDVAANVAFGLQMRRVAKSKQTELVRNALDMVKLGHLASRHPKELSGGQQQRVALARALVVEPTLLLLDEPLSNLDAKLRETMRTEIRSIQRRTGATTLFVTHDQDEALDMADRIAVMNGGLIEQFGTPADIYERPRTRFVADFIGRANLFEASVAAASGTGSKGETVYRIDVPGIGTSEAIGEAGLEGSQRTVLVRPHRVQVELGAQPGGLTGTIENVSYTGDALGYSIRLGDVLLQVERHTADGTIPARGEQATVRWAAEDAYVLPEEVRAP
ncbi:ABC transporter ATP-binding protein [Arenivirga flava]|uniref:ABC transporter ATP-binding protein n=1 Tax=Arenivirga flava TaxID=1930060 RepID=A0AA37ULM7_9MICO|nr:ABC transporter ATP-binding protein [Arenivirga flava]GMA27216.1 ABC transporter ATP-binding protein [Arenivirga flava]